MMKACFRFLLVWLLVSSEAFGVSVNGQLVRAQLEKLSSDPTGTEARVYYNTTSKQSKIYNGTSWSSMGGSTSGSVGNNMITNGSFEDPVVTGWNYYDEGALAAAVDGTGDAAGTNTLSAAAHNTTAATLINGTGDMKLTKAASDGQGEGWSYDFTLPPKSPLYSSLVTLSFNYYMDVAVTDMFRVYLYNRDTSTLITPQFVSCGGGSTPSLTATTTPCHAELSWVSTTSDDYRLIFHVASATATAVNLYVDDIFTGEYKAAVGPAVGAPVSYTPTLSNSTNTTTLAAVYTRRGNMMLVQGGVAWSGAGGGSTFTVSLPSGFTIDSTALSTVRQAVGVGEWFDSGATLVQMVAHYLTSTTISFNYNTGAAVVGTAFASGDNLSWSFEVPIAEWAGGTAFGENKVEYISHDGSNVVYGPNGSLVPNQAVGTAVTRNITGVVNQATDGWIVEYNIGGLGWGPANNIFPWDIQGAKQYGIQQLWSSATNLRIIFAVGGALGDNATYAGNSSTSWASEFSAGSRWRLRKVASGQVVGFGLANAAAPGLVTNQTAWTTCAATPVLNQAGSAMTVGSTTCYYSKVGTGVHVQVDFQNVTKTGTGAVTVTGLPVTSGVRNGYCNPMNSNRLTAPASALWLYGIVDNSGTAISVYWFKTGDFAPLAMTSAEFNAANTADLTLDCTYEAAS